MRILNYMNQSLTIQKSVMNPTSPVNRERAQSKGTIGKVMISVDEHPDTLSPSDKSVLWPTNEGGGVIGGSG